MSRLSNRSLSDWVGLDDPAIAFAFETECSETLNEWEMEQQSQMYEAIGMARVSQTLMPEGGGNPNAMVPKGFDTSKTERW